MNTQTKSNIIAVQFRTDPTPKKETRQPNGWPTTRPPIARLMRIHGLLNAAAHAAKGGAASAQPINCTSLAAELEVSAKTVQRDLDFMRWELHLPVNYDEANRRFFYRAPVGSFFAHVHQAEATLVAQAA